MIRLTEPEKIGKALRDMRHIFGLTQREMAELVGTTQGRYSEHETGKVVPDLVTLIKMFRNLELDLVLLPSEPPGTGSRD